MKAWNVTDQNCDTGINYIVFAETRGGAIQKALHHSDGTFDWYSFTELRAHRRPQLDTYWHGRDFMDWCNDEDRVAMVKLDGFACSDECCMTYEECLECPAHEWCRKFERREVSGGDRQRADGQGAEMAGVCMSWGRCGTAERAGT